MEEIFAEMGVKPKMDSKEDFENWMKSYLSTKGKDPSIHVITQLPQVSKFSGEVKGDQVPFDLWRYEVKSLMEDDINERETIFQAVRKSLRGEASRVAMRLGPGASLQELLVKLEGIYGTIDSGEDILAKFYAASQQEKEDVVSWGFRLENILDKAIEQKLVSKVGASEMLRSKFWTGLKRPLKDANRGHFESGMIYDELRVKARRVEQEHGMSNETDVQGKDKRVSQSKMHTLDPTKTAPAGKDKQIEEIKEMMKNFTTQMNSLQEEVRLLKENSNSRPGGTPSTNPQTPPATTSPQDQYRLNYRFNRQIRGQPRVSFEVPRQQTFQQPTQMDFSGRGQSFGHSRGRGIRFQQNRQMPQQGFLQSAGASAEEPLCFRYGQVGHLQYGCRATIPLN